MGLFTLCKIFVRSRLFKLLITSLQTSKVKSLLLHLIPSLIVENFLTDFN